MLLYRYDKETKEYIGCLGEAQIDPLESKLKGEDIIVIPPNCTLKEPKILMEGTANRYNEEKGEWEVVADYRGLTGFDSKTKQEITITELGELPENFVEELPKTIQDSKILKIKEIKKVYEDVRKQDIKVDKVIYPYSFYSTLKYAIEGIGDLGVVAVDNPKNDEDIITFSREEAESLLKYLKIYNLLLPIRKKKLIGEVKKLRSQAKIESFKIDFNLDKEIKSLLDKSNEEIEKYILEK